MDPNLKDTYSKYQLWINYDPGGVFALKEPQAMRRGAVAEERFLRSIQHVLLEIDYK